MAVAPDAVSTPHSSSSTNTPAALSWSHTSTGSGLVGIVDVVVGNQVAPDSGITLTVTWGGVPMTLLGTVHSGGSINGYVAKYGIIGQPTGAATVSVTASAYPTATSTDGTANTLIGASKSFTGADQTSPFSAAVTAVDPGSTSISVTISSATGHLVDDLVCNGSSIVSSTQTNKWLLNVAGHSGAGNGAGSIAAGASSVTMGYAVDPGFDESGIIAVDIKAAGGSTVSGTAALTSTSALAGSGARTTADTSSMTSASALAATASATLQAAAAMVSTSGFGGAGVRTTPGAADMTSASALAGGAQVVAVATASMISASALASSATVTAQAVATMASSSSLTASGSRTTPATAALISTSALAGSGSIGGTTSADMTSTSALTGAATARLVAAAGMASSTALAAAATGALIGAAVMASASALNAATSAPITGAATMASATSLAGVSAAQLAGMATMQATSALTAFATVPGAGRDITVTPGPFVIGWASGPVAGGWASGPSAT